MSTNDGILSSIRRCLGLEQQQRHEEVEMQDMENGRVLPIRVVEPGCVERIQRAWRRCSRGKQLGIVACAGFVIGSIVTGAAAAVVSAMSAPSMNPQSSPMNSNSDMSDFTITSKPLPKLCVLDCQSKIYQPLNVYPYSAYPDSEIRNAIESCESYKDLICFKTVEKKEVEAPKNGFEQIFCIDTKTKKKFIVNKDGCQPKQQPTFYNTPEMQSCLDHTLPRQCSFMFDQPSFPTVKPTIATTKKPITSKYNAEAGYCEVDLGNGFKPLKIYSHGKFGNNKDIEKNIAKCGPSQFFNCFEDHMLDTKEEHNKNKDIFCIKQNNVEEIIRVIEAKNKIFCPINIQNLGNKKQLLKQVIQGPCSPMFNVEEHGSGEGLIWPVSTKQPSVIPTEKPITSTYNAKEGFCYVNVNDGHTKPLTIYSKGKFGGNTEIENNIKKCDQSQSFNCFEGNISDIVEQSNNYKNIFCIKQNDADNIIRVIESKNEVYCYDNIKHLEDTKKWLKQVIQGPCSHMFNVEEHGSGEGSGEGLIWPVSTKQPSVKPTETPITSTYNAKEGSCYVNVNDGHVLPFKVYSNGKFGGNTEIENNIKKCDLPESLNCFEKETKRTPTQQNKHKIIFCVRKNNPEEIFRPFNLAGDAKCSIKKSHTEYITKWFKQISQGPCSPMFNVEEHGSGEGSGEGLIWPVSTKQPSVIPTTSSSITSTYNAEAGTCDVDLNDNHTKPLTIYSKGKFGDNKAVEEYIKTCESHETLNCFEKRTITEQEKSDKNKLILCFRNSNPDEIVRPLYLEGFLECRILSSHVEDVQQWLKKVLQGSCKSMFNFDKHSTSKTTTVNPRSSMGYLYSKTARSTTRRSTTPTSRMIKV